MHECIFCKSNFTSKSSLNRHHRTNKSCLNIQEKQNKPTMKQLFECEFCNKELTSKNLLKYHLEICKSKRVSSEQMIEVLDEVKELKKQLESVRKELENPKNVKNITINNTTNNLTNTNNYTSIISYMTKEVVQETFEKHFTIKELLLGSQKTLADFTMKNFLSGEGRPLYLCKDRARNKFFFTDKEQNEVEDMNATILIKMVYNGLGPVISRLYHEEYVRLHDDLAKYKRKEDKALIDYTRDEIRALDDAYEQMNIIKDGDGYRNQLSKILPSSVRDRENTDTLLLSVDEIDGDQEEKAFKKKIRMIGDYTISELYSCKEHYKQKGEIRGPFDLVGPHCNAKDKMEFLAFIKE